MTSYDTIPEWVAQPIDTCLPSGDELDFSSSTIE